MSDAERVAEQRQQLSLFDPLVPVRRRVRPASHPLNKLTEADVRAIRDRHPAETLRELAATFGVCRETIGHVVSGKTWAWLPLPPPKPPLTSSCPDCGDEFVILPHCGKREQRCRPCQRIREVKAQRDGQRRRGPFLTPDERRDYEMRRKFGITLAMRDLFVEMQGGRCAICRVLEADAPRGRLHVDHDHRTGIIRGMLCSRCNLFIGALDDNPDTIRSAALYLETATARSFDDSDEPEPDDGPEWTLEALERFAASPYMVRYEAT